ncbi:hypothetical protein [Spongiivirga citrea]|uniref:WG repeat-containing protein n=1 Tax=Spongiivirga citrea TaxID=1481457 RepID=A0A6M0CRA6_9FLAO|nr:hypothetical protein [Spongiivirga citrea]NER16480.1 hypothetical protein [Spongiivirga citrea]
MKKTAFFLAVMIASMMTVTAAETATTNEGLNGITKRYRHVQPIRFVERGVVFFVYPNGSFDYNPQRTRLRHRRGTYYGASISAPGFNINYRNRGNRFRNGLRVSYDYYGRIKTVGGVYITYNRRGKVRRIGRVNISYNRGRLYNVGGLQLHYNNRGYNNRLSGFINDYNTGCGICGTTGCSVNHFDHDGYGYDDDDDYFYNRKRNKKRKRKYRSYDHDDDDHDDDWDD